MRGRGTLWTVLLAVLVTIGGCGWSAGGTTGWEPVSCAEVPQINDDTEAVSWQCVGPEGGTLEIPGYDGSRLEIPPGALPVTTRVTVRRRKQPARGHKLLIFEPAGLTFTQPALLKLGHEPTEDGLPPPLEVYQSSADNPELNAGSEITNWAPLPVRGYNAPDGTFDVELSHFSFVVAFTEIQALAYLVLDLPPWALRPGDIMVTLTTLDGAEGPSWNPGHVALVRKVQFDPAGGGGATLAESTWFGKKSDDSGARTISVLSFKDPESGHLVLGARRPLEPDLTNWERYTVTRFAQDLVDQKAGYSPLGFGAVGNYSCVGFVEESLDEAGHGLFSNWDEFWGGTPFEVWQKTRPVSEIELIAGNPIRMPVYIAAAGTRASDIDRTDGLFLVSRYLKLGGVVTATGLPPGATFERNIEDHEYLLEWIPDLPDIGKTYTVTFTYSDILAGPDGGRRVTSTRTIDLKVLGHQAEYTMTPLVDDYVIGMTYAFYKKIPLKAPILLAELVDTATGEPPSPTPFPDHTFEILHQGRQLDAQGNEKEEHGITFRIRNPSQTAISAPAQEWVWRVSHGTADWLGDLSEPPPEPGG